MQLEEAIQQLRTLGTPQNVKVYRRHGAGDDCYGVSFANLRRLEKQIKIDHALALQLWKTGNADARVLATLIGDPKRMDSRTLHRWVGDIRYYVLGDMFSAFAARSEAASTVLKKWTRSKDEFTRQCGYVLLATMLKDGRPVSDEDCRAYIAEIRKSVHGSPNRARHAMVMALVAIGIYRSALRDEAIAAARAIGHVEVDHGETGCKTPDAEAYILKACGRSRALR